MAETAVFRLHGATCPSCAMTIEKYGRKLEGVEDIRVDASTEEIRVSYSGSEEVLQEIPKIVKQLGYKAERKGEAS
jgi:cation transport ATPase